MAALENVLDKDFVRRFLIEQKHTYEELVTEIKARYRNPKFSIRKEDQFIAFRVQNLGRNYKNSFRVYACCFAKNTVMHFNLFVFF